MLPELVVQDPPTQMPSSSPPRPAVCVCFLYLSLFSLFSLSLAPSLFLCLSPKARQYAPMMRYDDLMKKKHTHRDMQSIGPSIINGPSCDIVHTSISGLDYQMNSLAMKALFGVFACLPRLLRLCLPPRLLRLPHGKKILTKKNAAVLYDSNACMCQCLHPRLLCLGLLCRLCLPPRLLGLLRKTHAYTRTCAHACMQACMHA
jgi:hypothetical protein